MRWERYYQNEENERNKKMKISKIRCDKMKQSKYKRELGTKSHRFRHILLLQSYSIPDRLKLQNK